jgi:Protein of unknown function (DUF4242)
MMMSLVIIETVSEKPLTDELLDAATQVIAPCIEARNGTWRYSMLSSDRHRMICIYDAPDAESIRDAYRRGGLAPSRAWAGYVVEPEGTPPTWNKSTLKIQESTYPTGLTDEQCSQEQQHLLPYYAEYGVEWIRSYVSLDRTRMLCELNAPDAEVIRQAHLKFGFSCDRIWPAQAFGP